MAFNIKHYKNPFERLFLSKSFSKLLKCNILNTSCGMFRTTYKEDITIRDFTAIPFRTFSMCGIKLFKFDDEKKTSLGFKMYCGLLMLNVVFCVFATSLFFVFESVESTVQLTAFGVFYGFGWNSIFKMLFVWLGRHTIRDILMELSSIFPNTKVGHEAYKVREYYTLIYRYTRSLFIFHWAVALMFMVFPIIQSMVEYYAGLREDGKFKHRFPYIMIYPFNEEHPALYPVAYISQFLAGFVCTCFFLGSDLLLIIMVHLLNMQFNYLKSCIEELKPKGNPQEDLQNLVDLLLHHHRILNFSERINLVFRFSIMLNYLISILVICLIGFQVVTGSNFFDSFKFIGFLCSSLAHIYYICYFGTNLLILSTDISDALSGHRWYEACNSYQRILPLAIARAQRPAHLTAFKFFIISMESFTTLMTTSYQFFTLINNSYEETQK